MTSRCGLLAAAAFLAACGAHAPASPPSHAQGPGANLTAYPPGEPGGALAGYADDDPSALTDFREALSPYGAWQIDPTYGHIWVPTEPGKDFIPYVTRGRWAYDDGYVWLSELPWGWVTFHYGRWLMRDPGGWAWVPGRAYAGAHVAWRVDEAGRAVGWGALPPARIWRGDASQPRLEPLAPMPSPFVFVPASKLFEPKVEDLLVGGDELNLVAQRAAPLQAGASSGGLGSPGPAPETIAALGGRVAAPSRTASGALVDEGLARAVAYARPESAVAMGAQPRATANTTAAAPASSSPTPKGGPLPELPSMAPRYARPAPPAPVVRWAPAPLYVYRGYGYRDPYYYYPGYHAYYGPRYGYRSGVRFGVFIGRPYVVYRPFF